MAATNSVMIAVEFRGANNPKLTKSTVSQKTTITRNGVEIEDPLCANKSKRSCPKLTMIDSACDWIVR